MPLDPNIILQGRMPEFVSPVDAMQKAMTMKQLGMQTQAAERDLADSQALKDSFRRNVITNPDGTTTLNRNGVVSDAYQTNPMKAVELDSTFSKQAQEEKDRQLKTITDQTKIAKELSWSITDQASYDQARMTGIKLGLPNAEKLPTQYDPGFVKQMQMTTLSAEEKLAQHNKQREFDQKNTELGIKHDENRIKREQVGGEKIDKLAKDMRNDLDADKGRAGNFGQVSGKVLQAERLQTLVDSYKNGDLPPAQMEELALGMANMLAGTSGAARAQVEALVPHTIWGKAQDTKQWLLNEPLGAGQQKFVEQMSHTIQREKETANTQLNDIRARRLSAHDRLKKAAPDQYNQILQSYGVDPSRIKNGKYQAPTPPPPKPPPGQIITVTGKGQFRVGADGDSLEPVSTKTARE